MSLPDDMDLLPKYKKTAITEFELALTHALLFLISKAKARRTPEPMAASRPARFLTFCTEADKRKKIIQYRMSALAFRCFIFRS